MAYQAVDEIMARCEKDGVEFWKAVQLEDCEENGISEEESWNQMTHMWNSMKESVAAYDPEAISRSGLVGREGKLMDAYREQKKPLCGDFVSKVIANALKMGCNNACMKRIVAAPTAGSCGVIPAVLISYEEVVAESEESGDDPAEDRMVQALFTAAGIGKVIAENASIAGASGGCQAEIGTAAAMAAGALTFLQGGTTRQIMQAAAFALKNMLGLTCDPVGGLVEVPCIKRNVAGVVNAISAAQLAMAGIVSAISPDDTIDSMRRIGNELPVCLKETGMGGLAVTESAKKIMKKMLNVTEMLKID